MAGGLNELAWSNICIRETFKGPDLKKALNKYGLAGKDVDKQFDALEDVIEMAEEAEKLSSKSKNKVISSYLVDVLSEARKEMKKLDADDGSLPPLGEKCADFLAQAKKGQPRTFLLVCKGNRVKYLVVKKKPVKTSELAEAKKLGYKGDGYFGVITGQGENLVFNLSKEDGYTAAPCKEKSLKGFLGEYADFKCKPTFAIVETAPGIPFDEDDLSNPLIARFVAMEEQISNVLVARPEAAAELTKTVSEIRLLLQDGDFTGAEPGVNALATRLQELLGGAQATAPAEGNAPTVTDPEKARFLVRFRQLKPDIQAAIAVPDADPQISVKFNEIIDFAKKTEYAQANALLVEVAKLLDEETRFNARFYARFNTLKPVIAAAIADEKFKNDKAEIEAKFSKVLESESKKEFGEAYRLLSEVEQLLGQSAVANPTKKTGAEMARESMEKSQAEKISGGFGSDRGFELDTDTIVQLTKVTLDTREYKKFETEFMGFLRKYELGADGQLPVNIWRKLIQGLEASGFIKGKFKEVIGDEGRHVLEEMDTETGKLVREKLLAKGMAGLQPFIDHAGSYLDKVIATRAQGSKWAFWSGKGAEDSARAECKDGIVLEGTVGAWFANVWDFKKLTGETDSMVLWAALSELYAKKAAEYYSKFEFVGFMGPGSDREMSAYNNIEKPTMIEVLSTTKQVPPPPIEWYVTDCVKNSKGEWEWTENPSFPMGKDRTVALDKLTDLYGFNGPPDEIIKKQFNRRLRALIPRIKEAKGTPNGEDADNKAREAGALAQKSDFPAANLLLDDLERVLQQMP